MKIEISKQALQHELVRNIQASYDSAIVEAGLISAKWVQIKEDRKCRCCGAVISKGTLALTASRRGEYKRKYRTWICYVCKDSVYKQLSIYNKDCEEAEMADIEYDEEW